MTKYISVGKILNFHGVRGEAKVGFTKNQEDFILKLDKIYLQIGAEYKPLEIENVRLNKNFAIFKFKGINSINDLMEYKGFLLFVEESTIRQNLEDDEFLIDELVGMKVLADGKRIGTVVGVSNNGANDLLSVKSNSQKICLVPFVKAIVLNVDIKSKEVIVENIPGLIE